MTKVEELKQQIQNLSREDFADLWDWFWEQDSIAWDAQIAADAKSGRLAALHRRLIATRNPDPSLLDADAEQVFDKDPLLLTPEHGAELDRRLDAYEADGIPGRPAEDVIADIKKKL